MLTWVQSRGLSSIDTQMAKVMEPFDYQPLETLATIRVIRIRPAAGLEVTGSIHCDIEHVQIGQVSYAALSYEWGPPNADDNDTTLPENDTTIHLNGSLIAVRRNLHHALSHFRNSLGDQPIWIDALSINQSDTLERSQQVSRMGSIYHGADQVMIWPGRTEGLDSNTLAALNRQSHEYGDRAKTTTEATLVIAKIEELCQNGYWKRVWIQQEVFLAQKLGIMYGLDQLIPYETFDYLVSLMLSGESPVTDDVYNKIKESGAQTLLMRRRLSQHPTLNPLGTWLRIACNNDLQTSEPRDLIYGMLGVSFDCHDGGLIPDYDKPLVDVYLETILFCRLKEPERKTEPFEKMVAEKLGLSWDEDMEHKIKEYCRRATGSEKATSTPHHQIMS